MFHRSHHDLVDTAKLLILQVYQKKFPLVITPSRGLTTGEKSQSQTTKHPKGEETGKKSAFKYVRRWVRLGVPMNVKVPQSSSLFVRTKYVRVRGADVRKFGHLKLPLHLVPKKIDQSYRTEGGGGNGSDGGGNSMVVGGGMVLEICMCGSVGTILTACCCHRSPLDIFLILFFLPLVVTNNPFKGVVS